MPVWMTLLLALGITLGVCLLLFGLPYLVFHALLRWNKNIGIKEVEGVSINPLVPLALFGIIFLLTLTVLSLPAEWRVYGAVAAFALAVGIYFWILRTEAMLKP